MIMKTLYEGILSDVEDTLSKSDADVEKHLIIEKLLDKEAYYFPSAFGPRAKTPDELFTIYKKGKQWIVDVNDQLTYYGKYENVTDGSFKFGTVDGAFILSCKNGKFKSFKYGPKRVYGDLDMYDCDGVKNLRYCPEQVADDFHLLCTQVETLKWLPRYIGGTFNCNDNKKLTSIKNCGKCNITGAVQLRNNGFKSSRRVLLDSNLDVEWMQGCLYDD